MTTTILEAVTPKQIDEAIGLQCSTQFDRERFATNVIRNSPEFLEYVLMLCSAVESGERLDSAFASAMTLGIEIGVALVKVYERR
jgi:hypothetical protein